MHWPVVPRNPAGPGSVVLVNLQFLRKDVCSPLTRGEGSPLPRSNALTITTFATTSGCKLEPQPFDLGFQGFWV